MRQFQAVLHILSRKQKKASIDLDCLVPIESGFAHLRFQQQFLLRRQVSGEGERLFSLGPGISAEAQRRECTAEASVGQRVLGLNLDRPIQQRPSIHRV